MPKQSKHKEEPAGENTAPETVITETDLAEAEARIAEAQDAALRATAELQNLKRRQRAEIERIRDTASKDLVMALLPAVDDLERALEASESTQNADALREGVALTLNKLFSALQSVGVEKMPGVGQPFDPEFHEAAMQTAPTEAFPAGTITQEIRTGYTQHGHVIRPSLVAVAHE